MTSIAQRVRGRSLPALVAFLASAYGAAAVGGQFSRSVQSAWYRGLEKPGFNPPAVVFGPVWSLLYTGMAAAGWLVWRRGSERSDVRRATGLYAAQLTLNVLWSALFFGLRSPLAALLEIGALWNMIVLWQRAAVRIAPRTRWLIAPYLAWVSFAATLNASIWWKNR